MRMKMKMAAAVLGTMLASTVGTASAIEPGWYGADDDGSCRAGQFGVNDYVYNIYAVYNFPALRNGESVGVDAVVYDNYGHPTWGSYGASFTCMDGYVYYDGWLQDGPTWD